MYFLKFISPLLLVHFLNLFQTQTPETPPGKAHIDITQLGDKLYIRGEFENSTDSSKELTYKLLTRKTGKYGTSNNFQSGWFKVQPGDDVVLGRTTMNVNANEKYAIKLEIYDQKRLVSIDSVEFKGSKLSIERFEL